MGQKVHPGGLRVGVIHDWKSNWMVGKKEFAGALLEDIKIREHILGKLAHAGLSDILIRKDKQRITVDIYTARPGIVIGKSGGGEEALAGVRDPLRRRRREGSVLGPPGRRRDEPLRAVLGGPRAAAHDSR